jgi:putative CocE/NonD family hydrolase
MRDGVTLAADCYRPPGNEPLPAVLLRTPYDKGNLAALATELDPLRTAEAGFAVVLQDVRGCHHSEGTFRPFAAEAQDGADSLKWIAAQPWCSGEVAMAGGSYNGAAQLLAAAMRPPELRAVAPRVAPGARSFFEGMVYQGGVFQLGLVLTWIYHTLAPAEFARQHRSSGRPPSTMDELLAIADEVTSGWPSLELAELPYAGELAPYLAEWIEHDTLDGFWDQWDLTSRFSAIDVPGLHIGGWFDPCLGGTLAHYGGLSAHAATGRARAGQRLIVGPWAHCGLPATFPDRNFGLRAQAATVDLTARQIAFFERHLTGCGNQENEPPVRIFVMGDDRWRDEDAWPLARAREERYYLHSRGGANSRHGDGTLSREPPADESSDAYTYDPRRPVPTVGGATILPGCAAAANAGPRDQRAVEQRADVLVYTTDPLPSSLEATGHVTVTLYAATSARDTDFTAKLVDVSPEGRALGITDGIIAARHRSSLRRAELVPPGQVLEYRIDLVATSHVFRAGHRIRLQISSSNFPRFDRNRNTGTRTGTGSPASQTIFHDQRYPSHLRLPVVPR